MTSSRIWPRQGEGAICICTTARAVRLELWLTRAVERPSVPFSALLDSPREGAWQPVQRGTLLAEQLFSFIQKGMVKGAGVGVEGGCF
jgi:hypothetical protein